MNIDLSGKRALVTGAASGIGAAVATAMARAGAEHIVLVDLDPERLAAIDLPCETSRHAGDVSDETLWNRVENECGPLDAAFLNAGIAGEGGAFHELSFAEWRRVMAVNLDGTFLSLRTAMRRARDNAAIVLTASSAGVKAEPGIGPYGASKAGIVHMAKIAAKEGAPRRIRVNAIAPGLVDTSLVRSALQTPDDRQYRASFYPINRIGKPEDIAAAAVFFASDEAAWISGETMLVAGGTPATSDLFRFLQEVNPLPESRRR